MSNEDKILEALQRLAIRLEQMDVDTSTRLDKLSRQIGDVHGDVFRLEKRFDGLEKRFDGLEKRFDGLDNRVDGMSTLLSKMVDQTTAALRAQILAGSRLTRGVPPIETIEDVATTLHEAGEILEKTLEPPEPPPPPPPEPKQTPQMKLVRGGRRDNPAKPPRKPRPKK